MRSLLGLFTTIAVVFALVYYLATRYTSYFDLPSPFYLYFTFTALIILFVLSLINYTRTTKKVGSRIIQTGGIASGFFILLLMVTISIDLVTLVFPIDLRLQGSISLAVTLILGIYSIGNSYYIRIRQKEIPIQGLANTIKAMHLTDTHLGHFRGARTLKKIVGKINKAKVDVVFFTGDILDSRVQLNRETIASLKDISVPVFFIEGNHDHSTGVATIKQYLRELGVAVLENEITLWNGVQIIGLNHMASDSKSPNVFVDSRGPTIKSTLNSLPIQTALPSILLHHSPDGVEYASQAGVNLYLAGHTHAGQMFPATIIAKRMFAYNKGLHKYKETFINVCQGTGTIGPPFRLGTISEMTLLILMPT